MNKELVKLFGCAIKDSTNLDVTVVEELAIQRGYIVDPRVCNQAVVDFLKDEPLDYNSTFYASWNDIVSRNRFELLLDQILHYCTTYGTEFSMGNGYVPRELEDTPIIPYNKYKVITCVTKEEMFKRCLDFLSTDVALKSETVNVVVGYIIDYIIEEVEFELRRDKVEELLESIKNKEARTFLHKYFHILPTDKFELLRYIIFQTTGETMIIQNKKMINLIQSSASPFSFSTLDERRMISLSSIFLRYKDLFLAFKHNSHNQENNKYINRLRRLATKNHKPIKSSIWDRIASDPTITAEVVKEHLNEVSFFRKLTIVQAIRYDLNIAGKDLDKTYIIRNGRCFKTKYDVELSSQEVERLKLIADVLVANIVEHLANKNLVVKYASNIDIKAPTSEKSFIGDYPIGTSYKLQNNNLIGIYWRNEWGARDFDLSIIGRDYRIAWSGNYRLVSQAFKDNTILFSGDMTNADPEATEIIYTSKECPDGVIRVNRYCGQEDSKFRLFFAQREMEDLPKGYMVNPNDIKFSADITSGKTEQNIGIIHDNVFTLMNLQFSESIVSHDKDARDIQTLHAKAASFISLQPLLEAANCIDYDSLNPENEIDKKLLDAIEEGKVELIDLTNVQRDTLINLFK